MTDVRTPPAKLTGTLVRLLRQLHQLKNQLSSRQRHGVDPSAYGLLMHLVSEGPMRSSALAERLCADPSTVSRQAASLVELGMVERAPDPDDRRACLLVATGTGQTTFEQLLAERDEIMAAVLKDWDDDDVAALDRLLERLTHDLAAHRSTLPGPQPSPAPALRRPETTTTPRTTTPRPAGDPR